MIIHLYEHAEKTGYENASIDHFEILSNGCKKQQIQKKLVEALHIKHERPTLNDQEQSVPLKLSSWRCPKALLDLANIWDGDFAK